MSKPFRNPAPPEMLKQLEEIAGVPITKPMRKGTAMKLLRIGNCEDDGSWDCRCAREIFWQQLAKYTNSDSLTLALLIPFSVTSKRIRD